MILPDQSWAVHIGLAVIVIAALIVVARNALGLWRETRGDYEPRSDPSPDLKFARREEHDQLSKAVLELSAKTDERFREMSVANSLSREKIYDRLNALREDAAASREALNTIGTRQLLFDQKFDRLLERLSQPQSKS